MTMTTLNAIRAASPCHDGWTKLLKHLGKTSADDEPLPLLTVLDSNGLDDALWVLDSTRCDPRLARHFGAWCAEQVLPIFEAAYPNDMRPRNAIVAVRNDAATEEERAAAMAAEAAWAAWAAARVARDAASDAAWEAAWGAARVARDAASDAAWEAAWGAAMDAARAAAWEAARAAARAAARVAARAAARVAARVARAAARVAARVARDAASDAAWEAAWGAAMDAQEVQLRKMLTEGF